MYIGWLKNRLYLHNFACDLLMLCRESLRLERTLKTIKSNQHPISFLYSLSWWWEGAAGWWWQQCLLPFLSTQIKKGSRETNSLQPFFFFLNQYLQAETKGEIFVCGGTAERGEFVHKTHNETSYWLEQCCDTAIAVQYHGVTIINRKILPPHFLLQVRSRPEKAGILKCDWTVPPL